MRTIHKLGFLFLLTLFLFLGCRNEKPEGDGPTYGTIRISVDESFKSVLQSQISTFEGLYSHAKINAVYSDEVQIMADLLLEKSRLVVISRNLTEEEKKVFEKKKKIPRTTQVAYDGVALITNKVNQDTFITYEDLMKVLKGEVKKWNQLNKRSKLSDIKMIFDSNNSGIIRYLFEKAGIKSFVPGSSFAMKSNEEVIDYVKNNQNAIGFISVAWVSDKDDTTQLSFLRNLNIMSVSVPDTSEYAGNYYQPYQAYIAQKLYPLWRSVYIISGESRAGLGLGFASFVAAEKGQRIFLKSGLVPATMPVRLVEIYHQELN